MFPSSANLLIAVKWHDSNSSIGIGLVINYFEKKGWLDDMLIILTADNGVPFPGAKTNLYNPGANLPYMVSDPRNKKMWGKVSDRMVRLTLNELNCSSLDQRRCDHM